MLQPLCSVRGILGTRHQTLLGLRVGCGQHFPLATLSLPQSRSGEPRTVLHILINITDPSTAQTLIPARTCQRAHSSNTAEPGPTLNIK